MVPVADVHQLGPNEADGLPAKTLEACRSSLRDAQAPDASNSKSNAGSYIRPKILPYGPLVPPTRRFGRSEMSQI